MTDDAQKNFSIISKLEFNVCNYTCMYSLNTFSNVKKYIYTYIHMHIAIISKEMLQSSYR